MAEFRTAIDESKLEVRSRLMMSAIQTALDDDDLRTAQNQLESLVKANPGHSQIPLIRANLKTAEAEMQVRREKGRKVGGAGTRTG